MQKNAIVVIGILVVLIAVSIGVWYFQKPQEKLTGPSESITIGIPPLENCALLLIAEDKHYFSENGLNVTIKKYDTGFNAVNGLIAREVDVAAASEYVFAGKALNNEPIRALGNIDSYETIFFIARKDKGISSASDLKGKKIGVPRQTGGEFYLGRYLNLHGISLDDVTIVDRKPQQLKDSLANGEVDAVVLWEPFVTPIKEQLGENAVIWPAQSGQYAYWLVISNTSWIADHPATIERFWRSLAQAEAFTAGHPTEAKAIVVKNLQYDPALLEKVWPNHRFVLSLDQALVLAMEDESRWIIKNNLTSTRQMPNYLDYLNSQGLSAVEPGAVTIIR
jgi:NitT/TauT family transport system substrate-binding protein